MSINKTECGRNDIRLFSAILCTQNCNRWGKAPHPLYLLITKSEVNYGGQENENYSKTNLQIQNG